MLGPLLAMTSQNVPKNEAIKIIKLIGSVSKRRYQTRNKPDIRIRDVQSVATIIIRDDDDEIVQRALFRCSTKESP